MNNVETVDLLTFEELYISNDKLNDSKFIKVDAGSKITSLLSSLNHLFDGLVQLESICSSMGEYGSLLAQLPGEASGINGFLTIMLFNNMDSTIVKIYKYFYRIDKSFKEIIKAASWKILTT